MILHKDLTPFLVHKEDTLKSALSKIERNKHKLVYLVDGKNHLQGCLADGDFRRWSLQQNNIDLSTPVVEVANRNCFSIEISASHQEIEQQLKTQFRSIPLLDEKGHVIAIAEDGARFLSIGHRRVSAEDPCFIIAEVGNNHQGDIELAKKLVDESVVAGADCVKFQMRTMESLYPKQDFASEDLGSQYTIGLLEKYQLTDDELFAVFDYCEAKKVLPLCTPWDICSLNKLESYGMKAYKVASADFTNYELLAAIAATGKPMICSTGMSSEDEIRSTIEYLEDNKAQFILLHCNSTYPTPYKDVNLKYLNRLAASCNWVVGYSGHERGWSVPIAAVALGAKVIEKHITMDTTLEGNDHKVSLLPAELQKMVAEIRNVEEALGKSAPRDISQGELINREVLAKSLVAKKKIEKGHLIEVSDIGVKAPGKGIQPNRLKELVGKRAHRNIALGDYFFEADVLGGFKKKHKYNFRRPYGIPVRYHDFERLVDESSVDFVEFHLSYHDLTLKIDDYLHHDESLNYAVHAPELFTNDHLLDLAASDQNYRKLSIKHLQEVIEHTKKLKRFFPNTKHPILVVNVGGWNQDNFLEDKDKQQKYEILQSSLAELDLSGIKLAIQTMPPFPWHFGGQSHHNLFVKSEEIRAFCKKTGFSICLDVSHTMMACNYYNYDLYKFIEEIAPFVIHMHIVDAKGVDGEGVQIGRGDIDFKLLGSVLNKCLPSTPFIPEIWQGHKNDGEGFWRALSYLETKFND